MSFTLTTSTAGSGSGSIGLSPAGGSYAPGTIVTVTATPGGGSSFDKWTGAGQGTQNPVKVLMNSNLAIEAIFVTSYPVLSITPSGGSATTFAEPFDGFIENAGAWYFMGGNPSAADYGIEEIQAPNTDGYKITRHGFRGREILDVEIIYNYLTPDACLAQFYTDQANMKNANCSVIIPNDQTYPSCEVIEFKPKGRPKDTGFGLFRMHCVMSIKQMRLT